MTHNFKNYIGFLEVINSNPNGDPDAGGEPRLHLDGKGHITSVSVKRKMRDYMIERGESLICIPGTQLSGKDDTKQSDGSNTSGQSRAERAKRKKEEVLNSYVDARLFGHVVTVKKEDGESIQIRGAVQVSEIESIHPVEVQTDGITVSFSRESDKTRTMGTRSFVRYGVYPHNINFYPTIAEKNGVTDSDIDLLRDSVVLAYEANPSSTRQNVYWRELIEFEHTDSQYRKKSPQWFAKNCYVETLVDSPSEPDHIRIVVNEEAFREAGIVVNRLITSE